MDIEKQIIEIKQKAAELDRLISETLDNEPDNSTCSYGKLISDCFADCEWIDVTII